MLIRSIVRPLQQVGRMFRKIAAGQLDTRPLQCTAATRSAPCCSSCGPCSPAFPPMKGHSPACLLRPLTRLPNRRLLRERIQRALDASAQDDQHRALLLLDLTTSRPSTTRWDTKSATSTW